MECEFTLAQGYSVAHVERLARLGMLVVVVYSREIRHKYTGALVGHVVNLPQPVIEMFGRIGGK